MAQRRSHTGGYVAAGLGGLALLAGGAYVAGYAMAGDNLPAHASVAGVAVGGVDHDRAVQKLTEGLASRADAPITLTDGTTKATITPAAAGLAVDYEASIDQAGAGKSWAPSQIWQVLRGGTAMQPVLDVDQAKLDKAIAQAAKAFAVKAQDAKLAIEDAKPVVTKSVDAQALDQAAASKAVRAAWLSSTTAEAVTTSTPPKLTTEKAQKVVTDSLGPTLSAPVVVDTGKGKITLSTKQLAAATKVATTEDAFTVTTDTGKLWGNVEQAAAGLGFTEPVNARVRLDGGKPVVVPAKDGQGLKKDTFLKAIAPALTATGAQRTISVPVTKQEADLTTAEAAKLGVKQVTGEFTTYFPYAEYRNTNLSLAAASINNSFVEPGETFSLNDTLGPKGPGSGYVDGWVISGDHLVEENAGGVSQSGTTTFNAIFFAGLEDVEHHPHTMYFDRYPAGREATLYYGHLDVKFKNDTPYGVLLQAYVNKAAPGGRGSITVRVWSTPVYDRVESSELVKSNFTTGRTIHSTDEKCHAQAASPGFTVNYSRLFYKGGSLVKSEPFQWTYAPTDEIICD